MSEDDVRAELSKNRKLLEDGLFLLQVGYSASDKIKALGRLIDAACGAGFEEVDCSGSRAGFAAEPGRWAKFERVVRAAARRHGVPVKRLLYIADPGLGMVLRYT